MRLAEQYPGDVGVLSAFFFNYIELVPGQAIYLDANEPHAYLSGECLECMVTSDNVVRAGLTPKYIDTNTLCGMLTYKQVDQSLPHILPFLLINSLNKFMLKVVNFNDGCVYVCINCYYRSKEAAYCFENASLKIYCKYRSLFVYFVY